MNSTLLQSRDGHFSHADTASSAHFLFHGTFMIVNLSQEQVYDRRPTTIMTVVTYTLYQ